MIDCFMALQQKEAISAKKYYQIDIYMLEIWYFLLNFSCIYIYQYLNEIQSMLWMRRLKNFLQWTYIEIIITYNI